MFYMLPYLLLMAVLIAITWYAISFVAVTPPQVTAMATRIAFPGGLHLADPDGAVAKLRDPDEIVIPFEHAVLVIAYPLTVPASIEVSASITHGFTRAELVKTICEEYANVYEAEEATAAIKTKPMEERGTPATRNRTDGLYGIWGHDLDDLVLTATYWTRKSNGLVTIQLHIET
jgi:hypothetical protein